MKQVEAFSAEEQGIPATELRSFIERIERLDGEKTAISDDIKDVFKELSGRGYNAKAIREILKMRKTDPDKRAETEALVDLYLSAIGGV